MFIFSNYFVSLFDQNGDSNQPVLVAPASITKRTRTISQNERQKLKEERESLVLWRHPITTINYGIRELFITLSEWGIRYVY